MSEKYGGEVKVVQWKSDYSEGWRVVHVGDTKHDEVPVGKQCQCGWINFGVVKTEEPSESNR